MVCSKYAGYVYAFYQTKNMGELGLIMFDFADYD